MSKHLGVGLRAELMPLLLHLSAERGVVLNDPVVHKSKLAGAVEMRVGILSGDLPMGSPAGMADAGVTAEWTLVNDASEIIDATDFLAGGDEPLLESGYPGGVIASVLQTTQTLQENGHCFSLTDISNDSTHKN
jgi:hypothetical protein